MRKIGQKGFTLIELLAVITIMGILLLVAIPAVSRTIENSRRDTFATTATEYINAVRNNVLSDNIECGSLVASATPDGWYYFEIDTEDQGTRDLMESGGKSPFGNASMKGYVLWHKETQNKGAENQKTSTKYWIKLVDVGNHGIETLTPDAKIKRANVDTETEKNYESIEEPKSGDEIDDPDTTSVGAAPTQCELS